MDDRAHYRLGDLLSFEVRAEWRARAPRTPLDPIVLVLDRGVTLEVAATPGELDGTPAELLSRWIVGPFAASRTFSIRGFPGCEVTSVRGRATAIAALVLGQGAGAFLTLTGPTAPVERSRSALESVVASVRFGVDLGPDFPARVVAAYARRWPRLRFRPLGTDRVEAVDPSLPRRAWLFGLGSLARRIAAEPLREAELIDEHVAGLALEVKVVKAVPRPGAEPPTPVRAAVRPVQSRRITAVP